MHCAYFITNILILMTEDLLLISDISPCVWHNLVQTRVRPDWSAEYRRILIPSHSQFIVWIHGLSPQCK